MSLYPVMSFAKQQDSKSSPQNMVLGGVLGKVPGSGRRPIPWRELPIKEMGKVPDYPCVGGPLNSQVVLVKIGPWEGLWRGQVPEIKR